MESGLRYTILKNSLYMDIMPLVLWRQCSGGKRVARLWKQRRKVAFALREELAEASAHILAGDGHANKIYEMAGSTSESLYEVAEHLTEITETVTYENLSTGKLSCRFPHKRASIRRPRICLRPSAKALQTGRV